MKQITLMMNKENIEDILKSLIKYRQELMEREDEFAERYGDSLSNTGYLLEIIKSQAVGGELDDKVPVSFDIESYLNICDTLTYQVDKLNEAIINNLKVNNLDVVERYELEREYYKELYNKTNARRFEVLHL